MAEPQLGVIPISPMAEKDMEQWARWEPCEGAEGAVALSRLTSTKPEYFANSTLLDAQAARLSFYADHRLLKLGFMHDDVIEHAFVLLGDGEPLWLDGSSGPIHEVNDSESLQLRDEMVLDYIRFFFYFVRGDGGFVLIESPSDLDPPSVAAEADARTDPDVLTLDQARGSAQALVLRTGENPGEWLANTTVAYQGALFVCSVAVRSDGTIEMVDDEAVGLLGEIGAPELASLQLQESTDDRDVTEAVVAVLLEDALREMNSGASRQSPVEPLQLGDAGRETH